MHFFMNLLEWRFKPMQLSVARGLVHHQQIEKWERVDAQNTWPHLYSICKYRLSMLIYVPIPNSSTWKLGLSTIHKIFCWFDVWLYILSSSFLTLTQEHKTLPLSPLHNQQQSNANILPSNPLKTQNHSGDIPNEKKNKKQITKPSKVRGNSSSTFPISQWESAAKHAKAHWVLYSHYHRLGVRDESHQHSSLRDGWVACPPEPWAPKKPCLPFSNDGSCCNLQNLQYGAPTACANSSLWICDDTTCLVTTLSSMTDDSMICININIYIYIYKHGPHIYLDSCVNIHIFASQRLDGWKRETCAALI